MLKDMRRRRYNSVFRQDHTMIRFFISVALTIVLIKNIIGLRRQKELFVAKAKRENDLALLTGLPLLYIVAFVLITVPMMSLPAVLVTNIILVAPGALMSRKILQEFRTGDDDAAAIAKNINVLYMIGIVTLILTIIYPVTMILLGDMVLLSS